MPPEKRPGYKVAEKSAELEGVVDGRPIRLRHRLIYVWSEVKAAEEAGLKIDIAAPSEETPSMTMALEKYIKTVNK